MTPEQREAERKRFEAAFKHLMDFSRGDDGEYRSNPTHAGFAGWRLRAEIAIAEREKQNAEIERLRERVRELAKNDLYEWLQDLHATAEFAWRVAPDRILGIAHEAGVWFDDDGNEVPLAEWKARVGE
jgi:hypothetical protein